MAERNFKYRILVVDDEPSVRKTTALILESAGYEVRTSEGGFEALVVLRTAPPDLIISDLHMPNMSGFELLSIVRRRFAQIPVIAISGQFVGSGPISLLADFFFQKAGHGPQQLIAKVDELLKQSPSRPALVRAETAPVWTPMNDSGYVVLTCCECLRSFSMPPVDSVEGMSESECLHCGANVQYLYSRKK